MRTLLSGLLLGLVLSPPALAEALFRREVDMSAIRPTALVMSVEETSRNARTSEVKVIFKSGSSVGSAFFVVGSMCDLARERDARYFMVLREWPAKGRGGMYLIGFSNSRDIAPLEYFGVAEPLPRDRKLEFISTEPGSVICEVGRAAAEQG